jgi:hypothetical protein
MKPTHVTSFSDNTCAEYACEFGRPGTPRIHQLLLERQQLLLRLGVHAANERVASIDNLIADWLSRNEIDKALEAAKSLGAVEMLRLEIDPQLRAFASLA